MRTRWRGAVSTAVGFFKGHSKKRERHHDENFPAPATYLTPEFATSGNPCACKNVSYSILCSIIAFGVFFLGIGIVSGIGRRSRGSWKSSSIAKKTKIEAVCISVTESLSTFFVHIDIVCVCASAGCPAPETQQLEPKWLRNLW